MAVSKEIDDFDLEQLSSASNILLLSPSLETVGDQICSKLLSMPRPSQTDVLAVSLTDTPDDWLDDWQRNIGPERPANTSFITSGEGTRSATQVVSASTGPTNVTIHAVSSPADLTGLGMHISDQLAEWKDDGNKILVDFDSLSILLEYSDRQRVFKFMHVLKGRVDAVDAVAHYHMDPGVHDSQVISTFKSLMDAVIEVDEAGEWTISSR